MYLNEYARKLGLCKDILDSSANSFGLRFRALLEEKRIEPTEFARSYGIARSTVFNWLKSETPPLAKHWTKLAKFFGVEERYLITGSPERPRHLDSGSNRHDLSRYRKTGSSSDSHGIEDAGKDRAMLHPKHSVVPPDPTRTQIEDHVRAYLDLAEQVPGGIALAYYEVKEALPIKRMQQRIEEVTQ